MSSKCYTNGNGDGMAMIGFGTSPGVRDYPGCCTSAARYSSHPTTPSPAPIAQLCQWSSI